MIKWKSLIKPVLFLVIGLYFFMYTETMLWLGCLLLAIFFIAVDIFKIDTNDAGESVVDNLEGPCGVLGHYIVDSTPAYGLFIELNGALAFIDIRSDEYLEQRKRFATYLYLNQVELERALNGFIVANPEFKDRKIMYIGLHSKDLEEGEVFWEPNGHTSLRGIAFSLD